jgi:leukotriene-A4 hydrolase
VREFGAGAAVDKAAWDKWNTAERLRFVNSLPRKLPMPRLDALEKTLGLNGIGNKEVRFAWLDLAIANQYAPAVPSIEQFLASQGRGKFVRPLIKALAKDQTWGRPIAVRAYAKARPLYHPIVTAELDKLGLLGGKTS